MHNVKEELQFKGTKAGVSKACFLHSDNYHLNSEFVVRSKELNIQHKNDKKAKNRNTMVTTVNGFRACSNLSLP